MNRLTTYLFKLSILIFAINLFPSFLGAQGFTDISAAAGVDFQHDGDMIQDTKFGTGAAWFDYNKDGLLDLYVSMRAGPNKLFENNGDLTFTDVAATLGVEDADSDGGGVSVADFNNDGWDDLFLSNHGGNKLYKNNSGLSFTDITASAFEDPLVCGDFRSPSATWGDYDNDGFLDIYISQHTSQVNNDTSSQDYLYYNDGDETFTDVSILLDTMQLFGWGFIGGWSDFDNDDDMDIIVVNDCFPEPLPYYPTKIFENQGGSDPLNWNFSEVSAISGIDDCRNGMGIAVGDYNRDGWMDVFYTNIGPCVLFENDEGTFMDVSGSAGIDSQDPGIYSWGPSFMDYDLDGWQDIMVAFGSLLPYQIPDPHPNMLFKNNGDGTFTDQAPAFGIDDERRSRQAIYGDYDNDGDLDIFVVNYGQDVTLLRNDNNNGNHWLKINLEGTTSNANGVGARIKISTPDGLFQYYETKAGSNLGGGDSPYAHFGLAGNTTIDTISIKWPSGTEQVILNAAADQMYSYTEPEPLPVELIHFSAHKENENTKLHWSTASEIDNDYFLVQRSHDGINFHDIGRVAGKGTTSTTQSYTFYDERPLPNTNYYRLKQVDFDEKFEYSNKVTVTFESEKDRVAAFPNPVKQNELNISFNNPSNQFTMEVYDAFGQLVFKNQTFDTGDILLNLSTEGWNNGIHLINISSAEVQETIKVMVMK